MPDLAFLLYLNRSGSTLVASRLNEISTLGMSIEGDIPDGITLPLLDIHDDFSLEKALDFLFGDTKFSLWGLDRAAIRARLKAHGYPVPFRALLAASLAEYFRDRSPAVFVYKRGRYSGKVKELVSAFPDAKFIALIRDPRGIYKSQRSRGMAENPVPMALSYNQYANAVLAFAGDPRMHIIRYIDFIRDPVTHTQRFCTFLGVPYELAKDRAYGEQIPETQRHLHDRLDGEIDVNIATEWKSDLDLARILTIEFLCRRPMKRLGYSRTGGAMANLAGFCWSVWFFALWALDVARRRARLAPTD